MNLESLDPKSNSFASEVQQADTTELYAATLILQSNLYREELKNFLSANKEWKEANSIIEIGCGPGGAAQAMTEHGLLKGKKYLGIDIEEKFIHKAKKRVTDDSLVFQQGDVLTDTFAKYDLTLAIAVLQHLGDLKSAINSFKKLLTPDGTMIFFDTGSETFSNCNPEIPLLQEMYDLVSAKSTQGKRNDQCLVELEDKAKTWELSVLLSKDVQIPISPSSRADFVKYSYYASELTKRFYNSPISQEHLLEELLSWHTQDGSASLSGWRWLVVQT